MNEKEPTDVFDAAGTYSFTTGLGTFRIVARQDDGVTLWLGDEWLGTYPDAEAAAADVWAGKTGHVRWDRTHNRHGAPRRITEWHRT